MQHAIHNRELQTRLQKNVNDSAHLDTRKSVLLADTNRIKSDIDHLQIVLEKRRLDDVSAGKQLDETAQMARLIRNRHQDAVAVGHAANQAVVLTETEGQEQRMQFQRLLATATCLNDGIDIQQSERARLKETLLKLEEERVVLLNYNGKYGIIGLELEKDIERRRL